MSETPCRRLWLLDFLFSRHPAVCQLNIFIYGGRCPTEFFPLGHFNTWVLFHRDGRKTQTGPTKTARLKQASLFFSLRRINSVFENVNRKLYLLFKSIRELLCGLSCVLRSLPNICHCFEIKLTWCENKKKHYLAFKPKTVPCLGGHGWGRRDFLFLPFTEEYSPCLRYQTFYFQTKASL